MEAVLFKLLRANVSDEHMIATVVSGRPACEDRGSQQTVEGRARVDMMLAEEEHRELRVRDSRAQRCSGTS